MANPSSMGASAPYADAHAQPTSPINNQSLTSLCSHAEDISGELESGLQAFAAVEKLTARTGAHDSQAIHSSRDEMSSLMRILREHMAHNLQALQSSLGTLHSAQRAQSTGERLQ